MALNLPIKIFLFITIASFFGLIYVTNEKNEFFNNPLSGEVLGKIDYKKIQLQQIVKEKYNIDADIPIEINDEISNNLFGLASYKQNGKIVILLNKNRFKENERYMIEEVLPHEYAHAVMFIIGDFTPHNGGHPPLWERICNEIGGVKCDRFANSDDILIEKLGFKN